MMISKLAFAAGLFVASSLGGVALGSYTIGGFRIDDPPDVIGGLAAVDVQGEGAPPKAAAPIMDYMHVCKGCDAKLYRDQDWQYEEPAHEEARYDDYGEPEDLMRSEDELARATDAPRDEKPAVHVADAGLSGGEPEVPAQVVMAHSF